MCAETSFSCSMKGYILLMVRHHIRDKSHAPYLSVAMLNNGVRGVLATNWAQVLDIVLVIRSRMSLVEDFKKLCHNQHGQKRVVRCE